MEKGIYVKDIVPNMETGGIFVVASANMGQSRNGPYWRISLRDATGTIEAKIWYPLSSSITQIQPGSFALAAGRASLYRDQLQIALEKFTLLEQEDCQQLNHADFLPSAPTDVDAMFLELKNLCSETFSHAGWRKFVFSVLRDEELQNSFKYSPAAKSVHHAYVGGLLEHSLGVFRMCGQMSDVYPQLDRQTLSAAAIFHDIGKTKELSGGLENDYTDPGRLLGHIFLGLEILTPFLAKSGLEQQLADHFRHLIITHHGALEYGSPKLPQTAEAFALHYADNLDAKLAQCRNLFDENTDGQWSPWQATLGRQIYNPAKTPETPVTRKSKQEDLCLSLLKG